MSDYEQDPVEDEFANADEWDEYEDGFVDDFQDEFLEGGDQVSGGVTIPPGLGAPSPRPDAPRPGAPAGSPRSGHPPGQSGLGTSRPGSPGGPSRPGQQRPQAPTQPTKPPGQPPTQRQPGLPMPTGSPPAVPARPGSPPPPGGKAPVGRSPQKPGAASTSQPPRQSTAPARPGSKGQPAGVKPTQAVPPQPGAASLVRPGGPMGQPQRTSGMPPSPAARPAAPSGTPKPAVGDQRQATTPPASPTAPGKSQAPAAPPAKPAPSKKPTAARTRKKRASKKALTVQGMAIKERTPAKPLVVTPAEPGWLQSIQGLIPSWADEGLAILLITVGMLSFIALLIPQSGAWGTAWSAMLGQAFGMGAFVIPAILLTAGGLLLVPKLGVTIRLNWWRVIAGECFFVWLLAYIHASIRARTDSVEAFAQAVEGKGGGLVGWAAQELLHMLLGDVVTGIVLLALLVTSGAMMLSVRRRHLVDGFTWLNQCATHFARRMEGQPVDPPAPSLQQVGIRQPLEAEPEGDSLAESEADAPGEVTLPAIPGRPSIITGETGAGVIVARRPGPPPVRVSTLKRHRDQELTPELEELAREIKSRFTVESLPDKKRIRKRSTELPPLDLLDLTDFERPGEGEINTNALIIEETVEDFGMQVEVVGVQSGPTVTQYAVQPFKKIERDGRKVIERVRVTRVASLSQDLSLALAAPSVRIQAPVPGTTYIGVEVPNDRPGVVSLRPVIESEQFYKVKSPLAIALGRDVAGTPFAANLGAMPHLLIGGTTGSGKSVCITSIATCLVTNNSPHRLRLIMIDPKMVELVRFNGLPHLLGRVEVELDRIIGVLRWVTREMDRRYRLMEEDQARNIAAYNHGKRRQHRLPYIVVLIDELADLMTNLPDETEHLITRLAQMARATGIHLVVATQRPSTDILTGLIKANFPARIAFAVASGIDSRVILDTVGAEDLIGRGDMLFYASDAAGPIRLQGCFVSDGEMERVVEFWREKWKDHDDEPAPWERALTRAAILEETDEMLEQAIRLVQREGEASASLLQRKLNVGYPRAGRIIDALHELGVVGEEQAGGRTRRVRIGRDVDPTTYLIEWRRGHK